MIDKIIAQISESRVNVINEITNKTNSISKGSSRRLVRNIISDIYDLVEQYSSFLLEPEYLKAVVDLCESLYEKVEFQFFLPRIYRISLITSTEDILRTVICNNYHNDDASWLEDDANIDCLCKLFATEPDLIIE
ncbi:MAG TPA: hypothetical protein DHW71_06105, partial [Gammaproteobacteria bacterium]|nr:hypothetical protein [Gammaproteobacteria bacterium]